jgi:hypothetical protein
VEHGLHALTALSQTGLIGVHYPNNLRAVLLSQDCVSCGEYGAYLFLPACQRCCCGCLRSNQSLWVIPTTLAAKCFDIPPRHLNRLSIMESIPGVYSVGHSTSRMQRIRLTSVKSAKELSIEIHGSTEILARALIAKRRKIAPRQFFTFRWLQDAPLSPSLQDLSALSIYLPKDEFCGMASIPFPSLATNNTLERGLWCLGCKRIFN